MALLDPPNDKVLARRAARTRRSRWMSRVLFIVFGLGLSISLRLHPQAVAQAVLWVQSHNQHDTAEANNGLPQVRQMPQDKVTVNRAGKPPQPASSPNYFDAQSQADAIRAALQRINAGG